MYKVKNISEDPRKLGNKIIMPGEEIITSIKMVSNNIFEVKEQKNKKEVNE